MLRFGLRRLPHPHSHSLSSSSLSSSLSSSSSFSSSRLLILFSSSSSSSSSSLHNTSSPSKSQEEKNLRYIRIRNSSEIITPDSEGRKLESYKNHDLLINLNTGKVESLLPSSLSSSSSLSKGKLGGSREFLVDEYDAGGCLITPGFIDAHTHLFPPQDRAHEFSLRSVKSYQQIAAEGGGILSSVRSVREATVDELVAANIPLMQAFFANGTTTLEVKSGYGLSVKDEVKQLLAIKELADRFKDKLTIVPTFMGAHAVPPEYRGNTEGYITLLCEEMIPEVAKLQLATYCDVFCEEGYYNSAQSERILASALKHGLKVRLHADEFRDSGGAALAAKLKAHSADHLMTVSEDGIKAMAESGVVAIALPGTTIFLGGENEFAPVRKLVDAGCRVAVATDHNPGSSVYQSIPQILQIAMAKGKLTLDEVMLAGTFNPAVSLDMKGQVGTLQPSAQGDLVLWHLDDVSQIPYYGAESRHRIKAVVKNGKVFERPLVDAITFRENYFRNRKSSSNPQQQVLSRAYSTARAAAEDSSDILSYSPERVKEVIQGYVQVNTRGQITKLPNVDLNAPPPHFDSSIDHAPRRKHHLVKAEKKLAVDNALKYFDKSLHSALRPICEDELERYGHIYLYHLLPPCKLFALPFDQIPGKTVEARAMIHMILNNLNPAVAQFSQELITYGGNGAVFSNWAQFYVTLHMLATKNEHQCLSMLSGHPQGLFPKSSLQTPAAVISNGMMVHNYSTPDILDNLYAMGTTMYGQMTAGSWMYIGPQGIVHGTTLTIAQAVELHRKRVEKLQIPFTHTKVPVFVTSGLGGMSGAQPKAAKINGVVCIIAEVNEHALKKRHEQGWVDEIYAGVGSLSKVLARAKSAQDNGEAVSIGYGGNVVDLWEELARRDPSRRPIVQIGSDQTSLHNPYNGGYYPAGLRFDEANEMMVSDPPKFKSLVQESLHRQMDAIEKMMQGPDQTFFFDYGNAFLLECYRAGRKVNINIMSYVECIMGPEFFDYGFGPYRWVCTSGSPDDLLVTDKIAEEVLKSQLTSDNEEIFPQLNANIAWIQQAGNNKLVVGSQARILYSDTIGRIECAVRMNEAVRTGKLKAPVVIGRDHHDVSGTDSPWRETSNICDGSRYTADMAVQNVIGDAMRGATWVSLHNGGGTGWGEAVNGGFGLVLDGSKLAEERARDMIFFDVANGLTRRARAGNPHALSTIIKLTNKFPNYQPFIPVLSEEE